MRRTLRAINRMQVGSSVPTSTILVGKLVIQRGAAALNFNVPENGCNEGELPFRQMSSGKSPCFVGEESFSEHYRTMADCAIWAIGYTKMLHTSEP